MTSTLTSVTLASVVATTEDETHKCSFLCSNKAPNGSLVTVYNVWKERERVENNFIQFSSDLQ